MSTFRLPCLRLPARSPSGHTGEHRRRVHQLARLEQFLDGIDRGTACPGQGAHPADSSLPCGADALLSISSTGIVNLATLPPCGVAGAITEGASQAAPLNDGATEAAWSGAPPLFMEVESPMALAAEVEWPLPHSVAAHVERHCQRIALPCTGLHLAVRAYRLDERRAALVFPCNVMRARAEAARRRGHRGKGHKGRVAILTDKCTHLCPAGTALRTQPGHCRPIRTTRHVAFLAQTHVATLAACDGEALRIAFMHMRTRPVITVRSGAEESCIPLDVILKAINEGTTLGTRACLSLLLHPWHRLCLTEQPSARKAVLLCQARRRAVADVAATALTLQFCTGAAGGTTRAGPLARRAALRMIMVLCAFGHAPWKANAFSRPGAVAVCARYLHTALRHLPRGTVFARTKLTRSPCWPKRLSTVEADTIWPQARPARGMPSLVLTSPRTEAARVCGTRGRKGLPTVGTGALCVRACRAVPAKRARGGEWLIAAMARSYHFYLPSPCHRSLLYHFYFTIFRNDNRRGTMQSICTALRG